MVKILLPDGCCNTKNGIPKLLETQHPSFTREEGTSTFTFSSFLPFSTVALKTHLYHQPASDTGSPAERATSRAEPVLLKSDGRYVQTIPIAFFNIFHILRLQEKRNIIHQLLRNTIPALISATLRGEFCFEQFVNIITENIPQVEE